MAGWFNGDSRRPGKQHSGAAGNGVHPDKPERGHAHAGLRWLGQRPRSPPRLWLRVPRSGQLLFPCNKSESQHLQPIVSSIHHNLRYHDNLRCHKVLLSSSVMCTSMLLLRVACHDMDDTTYHVQSAALNLGFLKRSSENLLNCMAWLVWCLTRLCDTNTGAVAAQCGRANAAAVAGDSPEAEQRRGSAATGL